MDKVCRWVGLGALVGGACGVSAAIFLHLLDLATAFRMAHRSIVYVLPVAGVVLGLAYERWGASIRGGNDLVIDTMHEGGPQLPLRMAPMVLVGTVLTHAFGGSVGREGTAVQMGASLADAITSRFRAAKEMRAQLLAAGMAGGFGAVFGTPLAGAVFGMEVGTVGRLDPKVLVPALVAALVGDVVTRLCGIVHTPYPKLGHVQLTPLLFGKLCVVGVAMALATIAFIELTHSLKHLFERHVPRLPVRMFVGGVAVVGLWKLAGTDDYLGLGVSTILRAFSDPGLPSSAFTAKLVFTAVTIASGFLGGEVTPLFFIGATLGNVLAQLLGLPIELGAGVGIAAVFGAAANTPIALSIMAVELLGASVLPHVLIVTVIAYVLAGHRGIYPSQRLRSRKFARRLPHPIALRDYRG